MIGDKFGTSFSMMKIRYADYDESLTKLDILQINDKVSLFINIETVFKYLSTIENLESSIMVTQRFDEIIISNIINLAAHYYAFFRRNGLDAKVFLCFTDLNSDSNAFKQSKFNDMFRSYYLTKFNENPKFSLLTDHLKTAILPQVKLICNFIPNIYYIESTNIDGSLIPYVVSNNLKDRKNLIVSGEIYDSQYSLIPNFTCHLYNRSTRNSHIGLHASINDFITAINKTKIEEPGYEDINDIFNNYNLYTSLIAVYGDKIRSIDKIPKFAIKTFYKTLKDGFYNHLLTEQTSSPEIIGDIFKDDYTKEEFINNFYCTNILSMYNEMTNAEKESINNQIIDRSDINSLQQLNATKFNNSPLLLEGLLM